MVSAKKYTLKEENVKKCIRKGITVLKIFISRLGAGGRGGGLNRRFL